MSVFINMNQERKQSSFVAAIQWSVIIAIMGIIVAGNYYYAEYSLFYRILAVLALLFIAGGILYTTEKGKSIFKLMLLARLELGRVIWPTRPEIVQTFAAVMAVVGVVMLMLWMMDSFFSWAAFLILG